MSAESETSEIIRRRLFEWDENAVTPDGRVLLNRDAIGTCNEFGDWVKDHKQQVPEQFNFDGAREAFAATYPFHPSVLSVFERKWQGLPRFQQTRGILRLLALWVTVSTEEEEAYRTLQQNLKESGFAPAVNSDTGTEETFRWARDVDGTRVLLEFFCPVGDGEPGRLYRNPGHNIGSKISAIRTQGAELAGIDHFSVTLKGDTLDDGGIQEGVTARVANLLPFAVLKAFAIEQRVKDKDSYDLVWTLNAFPGGPRAAVEAMAGSPVLSHPEIPIAVGYLLKNFQTVEHRGPAQYARFERSDGTEEERTLLRRFAHGTIAEFLAHWEALALPFK